jgi:hypothetical protein
VTGTVAATGATGAVAALPTVPTAVGVGVGASRSCNVTAGVSSS